MQKRVPERIREAKGEDYHYCPTKKILRTEITVAILLDSGFA